MEITWNDDGSIEMFGNKLYTWEVSGDVLTITTDSFRLHVPGMCLLRGT
ncbi:MAG: hypothetical protein K5649_01850 [Lachnospiraceae bacterium]|nr:hypothetical protein [Lachnospiraceae bacterium]